MIRGFLAALSLLALLAICALGFWLVTKPPSEFPVPDVVGLVEEEGTAAMNMAGLVPEMVSEAGSDSDAGLIVRQVPSAGSNVKAGRKIRLFVVSGTAEVEIPDLVGLNLVEAASILRRVGAEKGLAGLRVGQTSVIVSDTFAGKVVEQSPLPMTIAKIGSAVDLIVAVEDGADRMPNLVGLMFEEAERRLGAQGYMITQTEQLAMPQAEAGTVLSQKPAPGARLSPELAISVVLAGHPDIQWGVETASGPPAPGTSYRSHPKPDAVNTPSEPLPEPPAFEPPTWKLGDKPIVEDIN